MFQLSVWTLDAVWFYPHLLDYVGGAQVANWIVDHVWVRFVTAPPLGILTILSVFSPINTPRQRAASEELATRLGATVVEHRKLDPTYGIPTAPGLRMPIDRWSMEIGTWSKDQDVRTVARVFVDVRTSFSFAARGAGREPDVLRGLQQFAMKQAMKHAAEGAGDSRAQTAAATMAYLAEPPITTGNDLLDRSMVLRANQPDAARALFRSGGMISALQVLNAKSQLWDWTFYPGTQAGLAEMQLALPGAKCDEASVRMAADVLRAALEAMVSAELVGA
ncbi:MAG: hypothetical protein HOP12_01015 [Candidatus Eisenbacteria bacterium]|uniref:Uncharacterized protein n=1 Tax=Eiseniibacteriota bacterium TaxID=2212470 RepID=A0A849SAN0_UNCEI|nr:hypothetical protein [Candidatus Eisenbacteria bacterium]